VSIRVIHPGLLTSFQDTGRTGYRAQGINPGGAMDVYALQCANILLGNARTEAAIELHFPAAAFSFEADAIIAITGGDFSPHINNVPIAMGQPICVKAGDGLVLKERKSGQRAYLAVRGGFQTTSWLGTAGTHLKAGIGGYKGRALQRYDQVGFRTKQTVIADSDSPKRPALPWRLSGEWGKRYHNETVRVMPGAAWEKMTAAALQSFTTESFTISRHSDRMGFRLHGTALELEVQQEMISSAVTYGSMQLAPGGQLIILMADHQCTGGYPLIAQVATVDMPLLAQQATGTALRFSLITPAAAEKLVYSMEQELQQLQNACAEKWNAWQKQQ
jgi:antagonist of KipI